MSFDFEFRQIYNYVFINLFACELKFYTAPLCFQLFRNLRLAPCYGYIRRSIRIIIVGGAKIVSRKREKTQLRGREFYNKVNLILSEWKAQKRSGSENCFLVTSRRRLIEIFIGNWFSSRLISNFNTGEKINRPSINSCAGSSK